MTYTINEFQDNNASIQVHWTDTMDNYSDIREREIEKYFKGKYKTDKVKVIFRPILSKKSGEDASDGSAVASEVVLDNEYQKNLITKFMADNGITGVNPAHLDRLDSTVNTHLEDYKDNTNRYKKFRILEVSFSNFLSYGGKNRINFNNKRGITSIISDPVNYGGKTTATIDVLMFLFFGTTTKNEVNADIFNLYTKEDTVNVRGEIELEGEVYVIDRTLTRTMQRSGEYKVAMSTEFQKRLPRGGYKNMKGDEKKLTEQYIKEFVGTKEDFLITILSTGDNLDDLIKTKPTERGRMLTRFIGLEFFREKEKIAKRLYDEWKTTSKLFKHSRDEINKQIAIHQTTIDETELLKMGVDGELADLKVQIEKKITLQEQKQSQRVPVDTEMYLINEDEIVRGIQTLDVRIAEREAAYALALADVIQPSVSYDLDRLRQLEQLVAKKRGEVIHMEAEIRMLEQTNKHLKECENCPTCARPLEGVDNSAQITLNAKEIENLFTKISNYNAEISLSLTEIEQINATKALWDEYNKKELIAGKVKFELEQLQASRHRGNEKLQKYRQNKENVDRNRLIDTDLNVIKIELQELQDSKEMTLLKSKGFEKDVEMARQRIAEYNLLLTTITKEEVIDKIYRTYLDIYGKNGISKMVLSTMIPMINHHLKAMLSETSEFVLALRMNEKNEVEFLMNDEANGVSKPLYQGSGFEKTVSSLALRCVLTKVCSLPKPNIILFDEVFSRVGNENLEKIALFFEKIKVHFEQIWLISHNPLIADWADNTIKIRKTNNISEIISD